MNLKNPESEYRPIPFWSWNDKLEINELTRQIKEMKTAGMGGFFMHARGGLQTKYLSQEWFDAVEACVKQAKELDMQPWLYDENGWPSGAGDGKVNNSGAEYQQKYLRLGKIETAKAQKTATTIAFFSLDGQLVTDPSVSTESHALHCFYELNPYYVDLLDHKVVNKFLQEVYEKYAKQLSKKSWKNTIGFFTDEPQLSRQGIPWSLVLPDEYSSEYDDDLIKNIPALFMELPDYRKIRVRFWSMITKLFMNSFMKQVRDWCDKNNCMLTGHHVLEESYLSQLTTNGAVMPQYCYYNIPGMDWLSNERTSIITMIQLSSAAAQMGTKKVLSETFAMCGWNISFSEMRHLYQYQMVHGINLLCQHLQSYSLRGKRKHDYPPSLFVHQPWWDKYHLFNDYVARIGMLLTEGKWNCKVLILHGQSSAWTQFNARDNGFIESYSNS
ncbi:MAG: glycosyl hydrolase, partial [Lentisphaerae bacterium]|nr:glycosyl hydrolase [Lentisphaerota bacterium]